MKETDNDLLSSPLESETLGERSGFRLDRFEVYNWGTFHHHVWGLNLRGDNVLLTGDIGSGKSTFVDAITTLLIPPQKIVYNKAAGAEARERSARTYVFGHYKSERAEAGFSARPVPLRDQNSYSVILGRFFNAELGQHVTLAQAFWIKDVQTQPARLYVVADAELSIAEDFARFGNDIGDLKKRLRGTPQVEVHDSFPSYGAAYRRRLGIDSEQALELFNQTVSMKSVGNLTDFVREHMLEAFPVESRIAALIRHFDDLNSAHEAVLKAKQQIERLSPLVADCDAHAELSSHNQGLRACREALRPWFGSAKKILLENRLAHLEAELGRFAVRIQSLLETREHRRGKCDNLKQAIAASGGDRIERLKQEIFERQAERARRSARAKQYDDLAHALGLPGAGDAEAFLANRRALSTEQEAAESRHAQRQNDVTEAAVELRRWKEQSDEQVAEIESLRQRRSNIPRRILDIRQELCRATGLSEDLLPFTGELLQVRPEEREWEGAVERVLHNFGLSLLVPDPQYAEVAEWVDRTHLGDRLVYFRVREQRIADHTNLRPESLVRKLEIKPDSVFYGWLEAELVRRFDYACCDTLDHFRREPKALTRSGQIKETGGRHEKDDRRSIDDRSRFVLGWSNGAKIAALEKQTRDLAALMGGVAERIGALEAERKALQGRLITLKQLAVFETFHDLEWKPLVTEIEQLDRERRQLEEDSDVLRTLERQLGEEQHALLETDTDLEQQRKEQTRAEEKQQEARRQWAECENLLASMSEDVRERYFPQLEGMREEALGEYTLTVESCDNRERDMREWLQERIDAEDQKIRRLGEKIVKTMESYRDRYAVETQEVDASLDAADEFRAMLNALTGDDLPRFEARFKDLLNENTIREVANFQSQLNRERQSIRERIETINQYLHEIDYNPGRYIVLEATPNTDADISDFQRDLRTCTEGALTGSEDETYSEAKFLQVKTVIERFRGREGSAELDLRWTRKVTDVRYWFTFSASERWREDDREFEHYTDSGGKSGGQKEKLAYTVLAAGLAYQYGLGWGATRSRSFRFVLIDEAFGRGSDESARFGLKLFQRLNLQLLIVTPLQKVHVIEPYVAGVGFVHIEDGSVSMLRNLTIEEYRAERAARGA